MKDVYDSSLIGPAEASLHRSVDQIRDDVRELINENDAIHPKNIDVMVDNDGTVTLRGRVDDKVSFEEAGQAAREVLGVTDVHNELEYNV